VEAAVVLHEVGQRIAATTDEPRATDLIIFFLASRAIKINCNVFTALCIAVDIFALCRRKISVRLSYASRPVLLKRLNASSDIFHGWVATPFYLSRTKQLGNSPTATPNGASNAGGGTKIRYFRPLSGFIACCQCCDRQTL